MGFVIFSRDQATAGIFVESMNYAWSFLAANAGERRTVIKQCVDQSVFMMTRTGMNDEPGRLVQDDQIVIFINNVERNRFRTGGDFFGWRFDQSYRVTCSEQISWPRGLAV